MLILSQSQAKNYFSKLHNHQNNEGCGCCFSNITHKIDKKKILRLSYGEHQGHSYFNVKVIAKIKNKGVRNN